MFSIALIAKNESKTLPRFVKAIEAFQKKGGDCILVDTGSTDGTAQIARDLGFRVFEEGDRFTHIISKEESCEINKQVIDSEEPIVQEGDKVFDFASARNYAAALAKHDIVFMPDCDEVLTAFNLEAIEQAISDGHTQFFHKITIPTCSWFNSRMYDKRQWHWEGMIHEALVGGTSKFFFPPEVLCVDHQQNMETDRSGYLKGLALASYQNPKNARYLHYFGRELLWRGRPKTSIPVFEKQIALGDWAPERSRSWTYIGDAKASLGETQAAHEAYMKAFSVDPTQREPLIRAAEVAKSKKDYAMTIIFAAQALNIPEDTDYMMNPLHYGFYPYGLLYWAYSWLGAKKQARTYYDKAVSLAPENKDLVEDAAYFFGLPKVSVVIPTLGRPEKLERLLKSLEGQYPDLEIIIEEDSFEDRQGVAKTLVKGVERATNDLVMFLGNDCIAKPNLIRQAVIAMQRTFPKLDGLVALNDGVWDGKIATHWLASKKLLPYLDGFFFHPAYEHNCCHLELMERCKLLGRFVYAPYAKLEHDNPVVKGGDLDDVGKIASDPARYQRDLATFERRKKLWSLPFTGERAVPGQMIDYEATMREHLVRYTWATEHLELNDTVFDMACGAGYGTNILKAKGFDVDPVAVAHAAENYPDCEFEVLDLEHPDLNEYPDTVVSFETIEHLADPKPFLAWVKAHANQLIFSIPVNNPSQFHKVVYSVDEIKQLIGSYFSHVEWYQQDGENIIPLQSGATFIVGIASNNN